MTSHKNEKIAVVSPLLSRIFQSAFETLNLLSSKKKKKKAGLSLYPLSFQFSFPRSKDLQVFCWLAVHSYSCLSLKKWSYRNKIYLVNFISPLFSEISTIRVCIGSSGHPKRQVPILTPKISEGDFFGKGDFANGIKDIVLRAAKIQSGPQF